jgi:hypothetical protein
VCVCVCLCVNSFSVFLSVAQHPNSGLGSPIGVVSRSHTQTHRYDSSEQVISPTQKPLPTQQTQETNIHALSEIRTCDPRNPATSELRLNGHRSRPLRAWLLQLQIGLRCCKKKCDFLRQGIPLCFKYTREWLRVFWRTFGPKRDEVTWEWREHNE